MLYYSFRHLVDYATRCHYNKLIIKDKENLPKEGPYIIAPCHQNAMMDPLIMLLITPRPIWFLCRGDIFRKPTIRKILTFLKILPVYRIRDGRKAVEQDTKIFEQSRDILLADIPLCLMAEGRHTDRHQLLPLGKGMFRIAEATQRLMPNETLYIIPVGLDYDHYERPYSNVVVNIDKPIAVQPFIDQANGVAEKSWQLMRSAVATAMQQSMFHIASREHYDEFYNLCKLHNADERHKLGLRNNAYSRFLANQSLARQYDAIEQKAISGDSEAQHELEQLLEESKKPAPLYNHIVGPLVIAAVIAAAILLPQVRQALLWIVIAYPIPFIPTHLLTKKLIRDPQFRSSINFGIRFGLSVLYIPIMAIVVGCLNGFLYGLAAFVAGIVIARLAGPFFNLIMRY